MKMIRQTENEHLGYSDTPVLPETGYKVHDGTRPQPPVVTVPDHAPPSDAVILFDGTTLEGWKNVKDGLPCGWNIEMGELCVVPGVGDVQTNREFGDCQLHLEFMSPQAVKGQGQGRGNSGIFLMGRYEIQVLDNYDNPTYPDGTVGAIYGQTPPRANPIRRPGEWNAFDILWTSPVFNQQDELVSPAFVTVLLNGVVQHNHQVLQGPTQHKKLACYEPHPPTGPLKLQDHGDLVRFRNIWIRELV